MVTVRSCANVCAILLLLLATTGIVLLIYGMHCQTLSSLHPVLLHSRNANVLWTLANLLAYFNVFFFTGKYKWLFCSPLCPVWFSVFLCYYFCTVLSVPNKINQSIFRTGRPNFKLGTLMEHEDPHHQNAQ